MAWSRAFQKCIIYLFLDNFFYYITGFCKTNSIFANLQFFLQILKVEYKSFPMMYHLSFVDIKHGIYPGFQVPPAGIGLTIYSDMLCVIGFYNKNLNICKCVTIKVELKNTW